MLDYSYFNTALRGGRIDDACGVFTGHPYGIQQPLIFGWLVGWLVVPWVSVPVLMACLTFAWVSAALFSGVLWAALGSFAAATLRPVLRQ